MLIQTALTADEFLPMARQPALQDSYRVILYHRLGGRSSPVEGPGSIMRVARDCRDLLAVLEIESAHIVRVSYSAAIALQLAVTAPSRVHTLTLIEPPPVHVPDAGEFIAANNDLSNSTAPRGPAWCSITSSPDSWAPSGGTISRGTSLVPCGKSNVTQPPSSQQTSPPCCHGISTPRPPAASVNQPCTSVAAKAALGSRRFTSSCRIGCPHRTMTAQAIECSHVGSRGGDWIVKTPIAQVASPWSYVGQR